MWKGHRSTDKRYSGDNRLISPKSSHRRGGLAPDVGSSHPGAEGGPKGLAVRQLKRYVSWVQTGVSQVGPYPPWAQDDCGSLTLVREDWVGQTSGVPVAPPGAVLGSYVWNG